VATINVLDDGDRVISDCNRIHLLGVNSSHKVTFLGLHVVVMVGE